MKIVKIKYLFLFSFFLFGCAKESEPLARVGDVEIYPEDLTLREAVYERCYGNADKDSTEVLAELIRDGLELAVLEKAYGTSPPDSVLEQKAKWIDENTKDPQTLSCIKSVYGKNSSAYLRNVVRPTLVNPRLHGLFSVDTLIHKQERDSVVRIFKKVMEFPESLKTVAGYDTFRVPKEVKVDKTLLKSGAEFFPDPIIDKVLVHLKPGEMWQNIIEDDYSYKIVRFLSEDDSFYVFDGVIVMKKPFDKWFREYAIKNIGIEIYNDYLKKSLLEKYPDLWWWRMLR